MSYQALYRVWRPQRFQDIAGQTAITKTLRNALVQGKTSHAYLFTGPRGTGKTSAAKIFAKAINCRNPVEGEPCNECEICRSITQGQLNDVIEIDAASNNGVEEIRDIRDKAKYAPTSADYKVYIIDEVHMLSAGAFNALLKTLEEPPGNVIFILATTEPHKIPLTIISRTQRYDFKRISVNDIMGRMKYILDQEKVSFEEEALPVIARAAEGGMRDALSILDQAISFGDDRVTAENAMSVTGSLKQEILIAYMEAIVHQDTERGLSLLQEILAEGKDAARFVEDLILFSRDVLVYRQAPEKAELLQSATADGQFAELSQKISPGTLYEMIRILNQTQGDIRLTNHADVYLEVATVRMTQLLQGESPAAVTAVPSGTNQEEPESRKVTELEKELAQMKRQMQELLSNNGDVQPVKKTRAVLKKAASGQFKPNTVAIYSVLEEATKENLNQLRDLWPDLLNMASVTQRAILKASTPVAASPKGLIVSFEYDILCQKATDDAELTEAVGEFLNRLAGYSPRMICVPAEQWPTIRSEYIRQNKDKLTSGPSSQEEDSSSTDWSRERQPDSGPSPAEPETEDNTIVTEAMQLFGEEIVEVQND